MATNFNLSPKMASYNTATRQYNDDGMKPNVGPLAQAAASSGGTGGTGGTRGPGGNPRTLISRTGVAGPGSPDTLMSKGGFGAIQSGVNEATDTVYGQLENKWLDFNNPIMKRVAQQSKEQTGARGLTNSSIAVGNANGAVLDQAGKFATSDAEIYSNRKTENQRASTQLESTKMNNDAQVQSAQISASGQVSAASINASASLQAQQMGDAAALERLKVDTTSRESIAKINADTAAADSALDRASRERISTMSTETQERLATLDADRQDARQKSDQRNDAYRDLSAGIAGIDPGAKPASQDQMANRIYDTTVLRLEALGMFEEALNLTGGTRTSPANPYYGPRGN